MNTALLSVIAALLGLIALQNFAIADAVGRIPAPTPLPIVYALDNNDPTPMPVTINDTIPVRIVGPDGACGGYNYVPVPTPRPSGLPEPFQQQPRQEPTADCVLVSIGNPSPIEVSGEVEVSGSVEIDGYVLIDDGIR